MKKSLFVVLTVALLLSCQSGKKPNNIDSVASPKGTEVFQEKLSFPKNRPCEYAYAFKISFDRKVGERLQSDAVNEVMKHGG